MPCLELSLEEYSGSQELWDRRHCWARGREGETYLYSVQRLYSEGLAIGGIELTADHKTPSIILVGFNNGRWQTPNVGDRKLV